MKYNDILDDFSSAAYNIALRKATNRELTDAILYLEEALNCNKYNKDARNLLSLIQFETGDIRAAIMNWVIGLNLTPDDKMALEYLEKVRKNEKFLDAYEQSIKLYNKAIISLNESRYDTCKISLEAAINVNHRFVLAYLLLSLIYIKEENYEEARKLLKKVLDIDRKNPSAIYYMEELDKAKESKLQEEKKQKDNASIKKVQTKSDVKNKRKSQDKIRSVRREIAYDDVIVPENPNRNSSLAAFLYICGGFVLALFCFIFLVLPSRKKIIRVQCNNELIEYADKLDSVNAENVRLQKENKKLKQDYNNINAKLTEFENNNASFIKQYKLMNEILSVYNQGDIKKSAELYMEIDQSNVTDDTMKVLLNEIKGIMEGTVYKTLADLGTTSWNGGNLNQAAEYYRLSTGIKEMPDNLFLYARVEQALGNNDKANEIFDKLIENYPESPYSDRAINARGH